MLATATALDQADRLSQGLQRAPFPYFLAIALVVAGVLWGALCAVFTLILRGHRRELGRLEKRVDALEWELSQVRKEHMQDLAKLVLVTEGVVRLRDELEAKKAKRGGP